MTRSSGDPHSSSDGTREILDDWDPFTSRNDVDEEPHSARLGPHPPAHQVSHSADATNGVAPPHFAWSALERTDQAAPTPLSSPADAAAQSRELLDGFELEASQPIWGSSARAPLGRDRAPGSGGSGGGGSRTGGKASSAGARTPAALPRPGDLLAGFRIIFELGRGAFARVYLAEEVGLGRRPVAIKVSRPDGNEPQILARLQHTHIVPVHSVCDDPESGLRVLCMPYFGGANLARVLEASGGLIPTCTGGRSLVKAIDEVSRNFASQSTRAHAQSGSVRLQRASQSDHAPLPVVSTASLARRLESQAASRLRSLLSRWKSPSADSAARLEEREAEHGQPSRQFLDGASAIQAAVWIVARLAEGLDHAHSRGLLHRDLKPANILLAGDGTPMLLDFNLSVEALPDTGETEIRRAFVGGTLPYMSPEHLDAFNPRGSTPPEAVDERSDIYALGLILFEMLSGEPAFPEVSTGGSLLDSIELMIAGRSQVPSLRAKCPEAPWSVDALVAKCLAVDPARRYARARDLAEDLRRFLENLPMKHGPEPSVKERMGKFARRHPTLCGTTSITLIAIVFIALLGTAVVKLYGGLQDVYARLMVREFNRNFTEVQFLLNTAGSSDDHLKRGLNAVRRELEGLRSQTGSSALCARLAWTPHHARAREAARAIRRDDPARSAGPRPAGETAWLGTRSR